MHSEKEKKTTTKRSFLLCTGEVLRRFMLKTDRQRLALRMGAASFCRRDGEEDMQKRKGTNEVRDWRFA